MKLVKNKKLLEQSDASNREKSIMRISKKEYVEEHLKDHISRGNFKKLRMRGNDNVELAPKKKVKLFKEIDGQDDFFGCEASLYNHDAESNY